MAIDHQPITADYRGRMQALATSIDRLFNQDMERRDIGFALLVFPFEGEHEGRMNYISNANRSDMITAIREWLEHAEQHQRELEAEGHT